MMATKRSHPNLYFWALIGLSLSLISLGLFISLESGQSWGQTLWNFCRNQIRQLGEPPFLILWQLIVPGLCLVMLLRGGLSLIRQLRATVQFKKTFYPLRTALPLPLEKSLAEQGLTPEQVVYLDLTAPHAFCLGFVWPRIWLTAGMVDLLSETELSAVLRHETQHAQSRDPLRLLISRVMRSVFFFLPLVNDLAQAAELQQEVAADQAAIAYAQGDLPLLCALQKLMKHKLTKATVAPQIVAYSPFNVTEARLRRLIASPSRSIDWSRYIIRGSLNLVIIAILAGVVHLSSQPIAAAPRITTCTPQQPNEVPQTLVWLDYNSLQTTLK